MQDRVILASGRAAIAGRATMAAGVVVLAVAVAEGAAGGVAVSMTWAGLAALALFGGFLMCAGSVLSEGRGGVAASPPARELRLAGPGGGAMRVPYDGMESVRVVSRDEVWGDTPVRSFSVEIARSGAPPVALGTTASLDRALSLARAAAAALPCPLLEEAPWPGRRQEAEPGAVPAPVEVRLRVGFRFAMSGTLLLLGLCCALLGSILMAGVQAAPVEGFLFGPLLAGAGACLVALFLYKGLGVERILVGSGGVAASHELGPLRWGARSVALDEEPYVRLRHRGARGALVEIVGRRHTLFAGAGVTASSSLDYLALEAVARRLDVAVRLHQGAAPPAHPVE